MRFEITDTFVAKNDSGIDLTTINDKSSEELVALNREITDIKRAFIVEVGKVQTAIQLRLEIVNLAEALERNADPEHAALAQSGGKPVDIVQQLENQLFQLAKRYPGRDIEGEVKAIRDRINGVSDKPKKKRKKK